MSRKWVYYVDDILDSLEKIATYIEGMDRAEFLSHPQTVDAVLFNLQVIGEAIKNLPEDARRHAPSLNWIGPARMRDIIAHHYFALDLDIVWDTASVHAPALREPMLRLRDMYMNQESPESPEPNPPV